MRFKKRKSDSITDIEAALLASHAPPRWIPSWIGFIAADKRRLIIDALKTVLASAIAWYLALGLHFHDGYWAVITVIIVLQSYVGSTVTASRDRALGTLIGAVFAFGFSLWNFQPLSTLCALLAATLVCGLLGFKGSTRLAGVTVVIVMLAQRNGPEFIVALHRVIEVLLGIAVALVVSTFVLPDRARIRLREGLTDELLQMGALFEVILRGFSGDADTRLTEVRAKADQLRRNNNTLMDAARNEPSGGRGLLEAFGLLTQFARSLRDALAAVELAVRNSHNDHFAQQLEPELGKLAADIHAGFLYVAGCVHKWRFHIAPEKLHLEESIAALERRMDEVRHTGHQFSQEEILRAYAVQLHLKQLARLLRTARIETSRALEERAAQKEAA